MAHALAPHRRAHPDRRARRLRPAGRRELESRRGLEGPALPRQRSGGSTSSGREFQPYTHYNVGGNTKFWGSVLYRLRREDFRRVAARRRRVAGLADRLRDAGAVLRSRRAAVPACAASVGDDPDRAAARAVSVSAGPACAGHGGASSSGCARRACIRRRCRSGCSTRASRRLRPVQHLQLVRLPDPRQERRRRLLRAPGDRAPERHAVDQRARARGCSPTRPARGSTAVEVERDGARRSASARRSSSCRAARSTRRRCCCGRRTTSIPTGWPTPRAWSAAATWRTWRR